MEWLTVPFEVGFVQRAMLAGIFVAIVSALVGTWVVLRGMAFLGDAMSHGMLPGIAIAALLGGNLMIGAAASAIFMAFGVTYVSRKTKLSQDTSIGLLFVGMLALGVIIVSRSQSFAVDLTGFLFGDVLGVQSGDLWLLAGGTVVVIVITLLAYRPFLALTFDERKAQTLGLRPQMAHYLLLALVTLAVVASYQVVGTLLVFALLIAPPATATLLVRRVPAIMLLGGLFGIFAVAAGLVLSWHAGTAAGASIALVAVSMFFLASLLPRRKSRAMQLVNRPEPVGAGLRKNSMFNKNRTH